MSEIAPISQPLLPTSTPAAGVSSLPASAAVEAAAVASPDTAPALPATPDALQRQLDEVLAQGDTSLRFRVDHDARRLVVSVLSHEGDVLLQYPSESALAVARHLVATGSLLDLRA